MDQHERNWSGNYRYSASSIRTPLSVADVQIAVRDSDRVHALGSRHSFNGVADSEGTLVSVARLDAIAPVDRTTNTVRVQGGARYGTVGAALAREGFALRNLASLPHISVAGACATATHGSGQTIGNLATAVRGLEVVTATGDVVAISRETHADHFDGAIVALGALGVVVGLTLDVVPMFEVRQHVYENLLLSEVAANFDAIEASAYSVSLFTNWTRDRFDQVWLKQRASADAAGERDSSFFGATPATTDLHPIRGVSAEHCTPQLGVPGPWHERLPHFRMEFTPSSGEELQSEYFVNREYAVPAFRAMMALGDRIAPYLFVSEVRAVAADSLWLSPCYGADSVAIHFTWKQNWTAVRALLPKIEEALRPFDARPHWGKLFVMDADTIAARFARLSDFRSLMERYDPHRKFRNPFIDAKLFGRVRRR